MRHPRVGYGYLPRVGAGYLPRVGAVGSVANLMHWSDPTAHADYTAGMQQAAEVLNRDAILRQSVITTPPERQNLFLPAYKDGVAVGADTITVIPACDFQAEEFTVAVNSANFEITDLRIGMRPLFASSGPIPASQFAPNSLASRACAGLVRAGTPIQISINCLIASDFRASFSGAALV